MTLGVNSTPTVPISVVTPSVVSSFQRHSAALPTLSRPSSGTSTFLANPILHSTPPSNSYLSSFMGGGVFCLKACDPAGPNAAKYCEHVYDRIGCKYNVPHAYQDGVFESC